MASKKPRMNAALRRFIQRLVDELRPERVILFGSRARGDDKETSDYDMLIIADYFSDIPWAMRSGHVLRLWDLPLDLEPICLTPDEFRHRAQDLTIVGVAAREGSVIYP